MLQRLRDKEIFPESQNVLVKCSTIVYLYLEKCEVKYFSRYILYFLGRIPEYWLEEHG